MQGPKILYEGSQLRHEDKFMLGFSVRHPKQNPIDSFKFMGKTYTYTFQHTFASEEPNYVMIETLYTVLLRLCLVIVWGPDFWC